MRKIIKTAAVLLMPMAMFAQSDRDTLSYQRIDLTILRNDLCDIYTWQQEDINSDRHVCEYSHELLRAIIEDLNTKLCEITD